MTMMTIFIRARYIPENVPFRVHPFKVYEGGAQQVFVELVKSMEPVECDVIRANKQTNRLAPEGDATTHALTRIYEN